jgi:uncharacterized RDD family membrane protein YckC
MSALITGDAVTLQMRVAALPSRSIALAIDLIPQIVLLLTGAFLVTWVFAEGGSPGAETALGLGVTVLALVGWPVVIETVTRGRSLGKVVMGLRVVCDDGQPIRMRQSLVRALALVFLDLWLTSGVLGGLGALLSSRSKRMGDHLAGTIVVGERTPPRPAIRAIEMPPALAAWAAGLDLVSVPDDLALAARLLLQRWPTLDPIAGEAVAGELATQLNAHVRSPAPYGTPASAYLAAVLAQRTRNSLPQDPKGTLPQYR